MGTVEVKWSSADHMSAMKSSGHDNVVHEVGSPLPPALFQDVAQGEAPPYPDMPPGGGTENEDGGSEKDIKGDEETGNEKGTRHLLELKEPGPAYLTVYSNGALSLFFGEGDAHWQAPGVPDFDAGACASSAATVSGKHTSAFGILGVAVGGVVAVMVATIALFLKRKISLQDVQTGLASKGSYQVAVKFDEND